MEGMGMGMGWGAMAFAFALLLILIRIFAWFWVHFEAFICSFLLVARLLGERRGGWVYRWMRRRGGRLVVMVVDQVNGINQFILWLFRRSIWVVSCVDVSVAFFLLPR